MRYRSQMSIWDDVQFPGIECTVEEDRARQEFKAESDVAEQLRRYGGGVPFRNAFVDYDTDLLQAYDMVEQAADSWSRLPERVRREFRTWPEVELAAANGTLADLLKPPVVPPPAAT